MENGKAIITEETNFYDFEGEGMYIEESNMVLTVYPSQVDCFVSIEFLDFDIEKYNDYLSIYDGENTNSPLVGSFNNFNIPKGVLKSNNPKGCLTFVFQSAKKDNSFRGWHAILKLDCRAASFSQANIYRYKISGVEKPEEFRSIENALKSNTIVKSCEVEDDSGIMTIEVVSFQSAEKVKELIIATRKVTGLLIKAEIINN